jgi:hypothetical protein
MAAEFAEEFRWPVFNAGYQWVQSRPLKQKADRPTQPMLTAVDMEAYQGGFIATRSRWYCPLREQPALFRKFADTPATFAGIVNFANLYGNLGGGEHVTQIGGTGERVGEMFRAEPVTQWLEHLLSMRQAVNLWDLAAAGDRATLGTLLRWDGDSLIYEPRYDWKFPVSIDEHSKRWIREPPGLHHRHPELSQEPVVVLREDRSRGQIERLQGDVVGFALLTMTQIVNCWLWRGPGLRLGENLRSGRPALHYWPLNLASALWLQLAIAVSEDRRFRVCKECKEWFEIPLRGARISREYCSNACRSKAYRDRQERARQLHVQGKSLKEIARDFSTDVKTVRAWVSK